MMAASGMRASPNRIATDPDWSRRRQPSSASNALRGRPAGPGRVQAPAGVGDADIFLLQRILVACAKYPMGHFRLLKKLTCGSVFLLTIFLYFYTGFPKMRGWRLA